MADEPKTDAPAPAPAPAATKPGYKTTEFWLMLVVTIAGLLPTAGIFPTDSVAIKLCGLIVSAATALGWTYKRTDLKKTLLVLMCLGMLGVSGCCKGQIRADAIKGLNEDVCNRHDKFVKGELDSKSLSPEDKATFLRSSELLRKVIREAQQ